ncbi:hypothetical protein ABZZ79_10360 [Streptomyces sp. NPDC006458]|uniref:hypothetical protein n=1 Tax=Streptomyces sp. NPDC006458 TaxID=3154302 RepID=UPI0033A0CCFE
MDTVDASSEVANGAWTIAVTDGNFADAEAGCINSWKLDLLTNVADDPLSRVRLSDARSAECMDFSQLPSV